MVGGPEEGVCDFEGEGGAGFGGGAGDYFVGGEGAEECFTGRLWSPPSGRLRRFRLRQGYSG